MMIIYVIFSWYAQEYANESLVYITNMNINNFSHGIFTVKMINFIAFFIEYRGHLFVCETIINYYE